MVDVVDKATRSRMMSGIRGRDTKPELVVRRLLHRLGFRFRLHVRRLAGTPDLVLRRYKTAIFVHGCFWHGHANCHYFVMPKTRTKFWADKISSNKLRDDFAYQALRRDGWRVAVVWECHLNPAPQLGGGFAQSISKFIKDGYDARTDRHDARLSFKEFGKQPRKGRSQSKQN